MTAQGGNVLSSGAATLDIYGETSAFGTGRPGTTAINITGVGIGTAGNYLSMNGYNVQPTLRTTGTNSSGDAWIAVPQSNFIGLPNVTTDTLTGQTINFSGADITTLSDRNFGNDHVVALFSNRFDLNHTVSAGAINVTGFGGAYVFHGPGVLDTSTLNGAITLESSSISGIGSNGIHGGPPGGTTGTGGNFMRVNPGTGTVTASTTTSLTVTGLSGLTLGALNAVQRLIARGH